ncbi:hypothetical protein VTG60DRAFT_5812 [Thermothelomyces hinnuleus]
MRRWAQTLAVDKNKALLPPGSAWRWEEMERGRGRPLRVAGNWLSGCLCAPAGLFDSRIDLPTGVNHSELGTGLLLRQDGARTCDSVVLARQDWTEDVILPHLALLASQVRSRLSGYLGRLTSICWERSDVGRLSSGGVGDRGSSHHVLSSVLVACHAPAH